MAICKPGTKPGMAVSWFCGVRGGEGAIVCTFVADASPEPGQGQGFWGHRLDCQRSMCKQANNLQGFQSRPASGTRWVCGDDWEGPYPPLRKKTRRRVGHPALGGRSEQWSDGRPRRAYSGQARTPVSIAYGQGAPAARHCLTFEANSS
jgi:hypothetical protein